MGRCCVCIYHAQVYYTLCRATALLFHPNPPSSSLLPPQPVPLPCRALQRGESSRRTVFCLPVPPDSVSLSLESAASFCPHCTSFRKERNEERMINVVHQCYQQVSTLYRNPGFQIMAYIQKESNFEIHGMVTADKSVASRICCTTQ